MTILLTLVAASAALPHDGQDLQCQPIIEGRIKTQVEAVLNSKSLQDIVDSLGILNETWDNECVAARYNASDEVVTQLSRLLAVRDARLTTASMLIDVGPNLHTAKIALKKSLRDQTNIERKIEEAAFPSVPTTRHTVSMSLQCAIKKSKTGRLDDKLCVELMRMKLP